MKRMKKISFALVIVTVLVCCIFLSGCHQHNYSKTVVQPTCTEKGYTKYTCVSCGDTYQDDYVNAWGHTYTETNVAATCVQKGYTLRQCTRCRVSYRSNETGDYGNHTGVGKCTKCSTDFFELLKNHCSKFGTYDQEGDFYMIILDPIKYDDTSFLPALSYDVELNRLSWILQAYTLNSSGNNTLFINMNKINGEYSYTLMSKGSLDITMMGDFKASSLSKLSSLPYSISSTGIASLNTSLAKLACSMAQALVTFADLYYISSGLQISSANLGFE